MTKFKAVNMKAESSHDHQPMAIFQSVLLPPPPTLPAPCFPFFPLFFPCREGGGRREIRPHIQIQASTLHPQPPVPPPSVHVPLPATPQQQGPEPPPRSQSITGEREKKTERKWKERKDGWRWRGVEGVAGKRRGEEKRK